MNKKVQLKSAYIDGEMSAKEYLEFEKTLSDKEINNLKADVEFEKSLGHHFNSGPKCPDDLWQSLKAQMEERNEDEVPSPTPVKEVETKKPIDFKPYIMSFFAAAAAVMITLSVQDKVTPNTAQPIAQAPVESNNLLKNSADLWTVPVSVDVLKHQSTNAKSLQDAQQLLVANNFNIDITKPNESYHDINFLGAKKEVFNGEEVMVLFYSCCGEPMKVLVTCAGGKACAQITNELKQDSGSKVKFDKLIDKYRLALIGDHYSNDVLGTIGGPQI